MWNAQLKTDRPIHLYGLQDLEAKGFLDKSKKPLQVKGILLGTIEAGSGTISEQEAPGTLLGKSCKPPSWFKTSLDHFAALRNVLRLIMTGSHKLRELDRDLYYRYLYDGGLTQFTSLQAYPETRNWLKRYGSFRIFGTELSTLLKSSSSVRILPVTDRSPKEKLERQKAEEASKEESSIVADVLAMDMRLAYGTFGLGWVDKNARPGDTITVVRGCSVPMVLRERAEGGYTVIGDAIVYKAMHGEKMISQSGGELGLWNFEVICLY